VASSCTFEQLVSRVAEMLRAGAPLDHIDRLLEMLSPVYRAEVLSAARDVLAHAPARQR
jgi:hypothetical protein